MKNEHSNLRAARERFDVEQLRIQFLKDRRLAVLYNQIAAIYNFSVPIGMSCDRVLVYEPEVEIEVNRLRSIIADIIRNEYSVLVMQNQ